VLFAPSAGTTHDARTKADVIIKTAASRFAICAPLSGLITCT
jgi:hypothetical protein